MNVLERTFGSRSRPTRRGGFTLIELVMVIMILAIVAGLAVPIVGWLRRSANYGAQANTTASLASNLELFRTTYGNNSYPDGFDSLLKQDETLIDYTDGGWQDLFAAGTLAAGTDERACLKWLTTVYDHTISAHSPDADGDPQVLQGNPGNTAIYPRPLADGGPVAVVDLTSDEGLALMNELYPLADPDSFGVNGAGTFENVTEGSGSSGTFGPESIKLVAFGIGQSNEAVGRTLQSTPLDPRVDNSQVYGRYAAIFAVYPERAGRRAQLKAIVNAKGRTTNNALSEFWQSTNPE